MATTRNSTTARPISFEALHAAKRAGTLVQWLCEMTSVERVEAAQVCAANSQRSVSDWLRTFGELMEREGAPTPPTPAPAAPALTPARVAVLVPSSSDKKLVYIVRGHGASCTCRGWHFRKTCSHARAVREARVAGIVAALQARRPAALAA